MVDHFLSIQLSSQTPPRPPDPPGERSHRGLTRASLGALISLFRGSLRRGRCRSPLSALRGGQMGSPMLLGRRGSFSRRVSGGSFGERNTWWVLGGLGRSRERRIILLPRHPGEKGEGTARENRHTRNRSRWGLYHGGKKAHGAKLCIRCLLSSSPGTPHPLIPVHCCSQGGRA